MPQPLTDIAALARQRRRALARADPARFLHDAAIAEVQERLALVNRGFRSPALVTGFAPFWAPAFPGARIVRDDDRLALEPGAHDLVIHAMGLHWANDPVGQLVQCRRALRPDGMFLAIFFGGQTLQELRRVLADAEATLRGGLAPRVAPMGEIRDLGALLQRAGFALPVADLVPLTATYATLQDLLHDLRAMGETNALAARDRRPLPRAVLDHAARQYSLAFGNSDGRLPASFELILLTGWAPDASQQQPLRPGSATARLADALGAEETPLPREPLD
ncbi:MAG: methyltransferase domain-containing protein [Pseudomonadota bacterium]